MSRPSPGLPPYEPPPLQAPLPRDAVLGIDARAALDPAGGGVGRYVRNLVRELARLPGVPKTALYVPRPATARELDIPETGPLYVRPVIARMGWLRLALPLALRRDGVRVVHFPSSLMPPWVPCRRVITIYDLAFEFFPETYQPADLEMQKRAVRRAARADRIITDSRQTAEDLIRLYHVPEDRVRAIHLAAEPRFFAPPLPEERPPFDLRPGYVLYVGALQPRKNLGRLIEGYAMAHKQGLQAPLVLAGSGEEDYVLALQRTADACRVSERVLFPGRVPEEALPALYRGALVLAYPSLYEGFGLPPLEAMACGTPVVAANTSCFPEVLGDAALLVNPQDPGDIGRALLRVGSDEVCRADLARCGRERAAGYSWEETARQTLEVYRQVGG